MDDTPKESVAPQPPRELGHIGDGVYVSFDGYQLWLAVNDHHRKVIALEPAVFERLVEIGEQIFGRRR